MLAASYALLMYDRANAVEVGAAVVDSMIAACAISFACREQRHVLSAERRGLGISLWARGPSPRPRGRDKGIGETPILNAAAMLGPLSQLLLRMGWRVAAKIRGEGCALIQTSSAAPDGSLADSVNRRLTLYRHYGSSGSLLDST